MRALVQRVTEARVRVDGEVVGAIGPGLCVLVGVTHDDTGATARRLADKVWNLRILADDRLADDHLADDRTAMTLSAADRAAPVLVVSQFTLYGDTSRGRRPSWSAAAPPGLAEGLVDEFVAALVDAGAEVATGRFGAQMAVELVNDGPVTVMVDL